MTITARDIIAPTFQNLDVLEDYLVPEDVKQMCHSGTCNTCGNRAHFTGNILTRDRFALLVFCDGCTLFITSEYAMKERANDE